MGVRYLSVCSMVGVLLCAACCEAAGARGRYSFFRKLGHKQTARRVFGGWEERAGAWPAACALLDRALEARCSCAVLATRWALTAAHCAVPAVAFVQHNSPERKGANIVAVRLIYAHPDFKVEEKDLGLGMDVVTLQHDVGLVRTRADMHLPAPAYFTLPAAAVRAGDAIPDLAPYNIDDLLGKDINVLGYGMTDQRAGGEHLRSVQLTLMACQRPGWLHCSCALGHAAGVCSGDSGGPVLYNGTQIGITSMGPVECGPETQPQEIVMSVFTQLRPYSQLVDDTIRDVDSALRMRVVPPDTVGASGARTLTSAAPPAPAAVLALIAPLVCWIF